MILTRRKDDEKQQNIKNAVVQLILEEGFQGASISKIARAAGVSPATVYIYYDNKDAMLRDIYREYADDTVRYLLACVQPGMDGGEIIAELIRQYYFFIIRNQEIFYFIEQFSACPALCAGCGGAREPAYLNRLLNELKRRRILNDYDNDNLYAVLFSPVKAIACRGGGCSDDAMNRLNELIGIVQRALLRGL